MGLGKWWKNGVLVLALSKLISSSTALGEAPVTTSVGIMNRSISYTLVSATGGTTPTDTSTKNEAISSPAICERISTPSALGFEMGAGGCAQVGGTYTFAHAVSAHVMLLYYPLASRSKLDDDGALKMKLISFSNLYILLIGGFSKITHQQALETNLTISTDVMDVGGGLGYSYRVFNDAAFGAEAYYLSGSIMSNAVTGSTSALFAGGSVTFFF